MPADRDDDDSPSEGRKSSKGPKKRFEERDDKADDDDGPRKKRSRGDADEGDDAPRSKRRGDADADEDDAPKKKRRGDDDEDDAPRKKKRSAADDGPRVKSNDNIPVVMLLAFIGSALALLVICGGCGWWSFDWIVGGNGGGGDGGGGGGWGGNEIEVAKVTRTPGFRPTDAPSVGWTVTQKQALSSGSGQYYVVMKQGGSTVTEQIYPTGKGWSYTSSRTQLGLKGAVGKLEVWVEKRPNPVATGKVVSNVVTVP